MAQRISFLFGSPRKVSFQDPTQPVSKTLLVEFDATLSENHDIKAEITDHPVELGSKITDHYRILPLSITVNGIVSDTQLLPFASLIGGATLAASVIAPPQIGKIVTNLASAGSLITSLIKRAQDSPVDKAYQTLTTTMKLGTLITVSTTLKTYTNMLITSVTIKRDSQNGNVLNSTITLREIKFASTDEVSNPASPSDSKNNALVSKGTKDTAAANTAQSSLIQDALKTVTKFL